MYSRGRIRNGAAIAAALIAGTGALDAQQPATTRPRDSVVFRLFAPNSMSLDSLRALLKEFDREQYGTQRWITLTGRIDSLFRIPIASNAAVVMRGMFGAEAGRQGWDRLGWLGMRTQGPNRQMSTNGELFVTQFAYPVIVTVDPQSPAEKAGIMAGDVLVAYNGIDVVNHEFNLTTLLKPDSKIGVTVRRDGETKEYQLVAARAPRRILDIRASEAQGSTGDGRGERPDGQRHDVYFNEPIGRGFSRTVPASPLLAITPNGLFGANLSTVSNELATAFDLKVGVLVNDVPEDSPAFRAGLRAGDVITAVGDRAVISLSELRQRAFALSRERAIPLVVTRNKKSRTVTVSLTPTPSPSP